MMSKEWGRRSLWQCAATGQNGLRSAGCRFGFRACSRCHSKLPGTSARVKPGMGFRERLSRKIRATSALYASKSPNCARSIPTITNPRVALKNAGVRDSGVAVPAKIPANNHDVKRIPQTLKNKVRKRLQCLREFGAILQHIRIHIPAQRAGLPPLECQNTSGARTSHPTRLHRTAWVFPRRCPRPRKKSPNRVPVPVAHKSPRCPHARDCAYTPPQRLSLLPSL